MVELSKKQKIDFLLQKQFPDYKRLRLPVSPISVRSSNINWDALSRTLEKIDAYEAGLKAKSLDEISDLFEKEKEKDRQIKKTKAEFEEKKQFYNHPNANADFEHWSKAPYWTLDEAIALSLGKEPDMVNWKAITRLYSYTPLPFVEKYGRRRDLVLRAKNFNQLSELSLPVDFLAWANQIDMELPEKLIEQVKARANMITDWKKRYEQLEEQFKSLQEKYHLLFKKLEKYSLKEEQGQIIRKGYCWQQFDDMAARAVNEYETWSQSQSKIQKTGNLHEWLTKTIGAKDREAEIIKKFLSDFYKELQ